MHDIESFKSRGDMCDVSCNKLKYNALLVFVCVTPPRYV